MNMRILFFLALSRTPSICDFFTTKKTIVCPVGHTIVLLLFNDLIYEILDFGVDYLVMRIQNVLCINDCE